MRDAVHKAHLGAVLSMRWSAVQSISFVKHTDVLPRTGILDMIDYGEMYARPVN